MDKFSYGLGMGIGQNLLSMNVSEMSVEDFVNGMKAVLEGVTTPIPTDFETAGAAIGEVNTRFGLTGDALEDLSGQFVKFAKLNDRKSKFITIITMEI